MINKSIFLWVVFNLVSVIFYLVFFDSLKMHYCGQAEVKPRLVMGFTPKWFGRTFQINIGPKAIISSNETFKPYSDPYVKGADQYKTITAYDANSDDSGLYFKAIGFNDVESVYLLREYAPSYSNDFAYEVVEAREDRTKAHHWISVSSMACRVGFYPFGIYFFIFLFVILNAVVVYQVVILPIAKKSKPDAK